MTPDNNDKDRLPDELLRRAMAQAGEEKAQAADSEADDTHGDGEDTHGDAAHEAEGAGEGYVLVPEESEAEAADAPASRKERRKQRRKESEERARDTLKRLADMADDEEHIEMSLRNVAGGEFFRSRFFRRQIGYIALLAVLAVIYVTNRYACQREEIEREKLGDILVDRQFKAFTAQSELTEYSLQSNVEANLTDTTLQVNVRPTLLLPVDSLTDEDDAE